MQGGGPLHQTPLQTFFRHTSHKLKFKRLTPLDLTETLIRRAILRHFSVLSLDFPVSLSGTKNLLLEDL